MLTIKEIGCVLLLVIVMAIAGCGTTKQVDKPVTVPCLGPFVDAPDYEFGRGPYPGDASAVVALSRDLVKAKQYSTDLNARMAGCR